MPAEPYGMLARAASDFQNSIRRLRVEHPQDLLPPPRALRRIVGEPVIAMQLGVKIMPVVLRRFGGFGVMDPSRRRSPAHPTPAKPSITADCNLPSLRRGKRGDGFFGRGGGRGPRQGGLRPFGGAFLLGRLSFG